MPILLETLRRVLQGRRDVQIALLFGSRARGDARPASDVDVAVHAPGADLFALAAALSQVTELEVDVVELGDASVPLLARVLREGIPVYEGARGQLAAWRARALADLETDGPWFARMRDAWLAKVARDGV